MMILMMMLMMYNIMLNIIHKYFFINIIIIIINIFTLIGMDFLLSILRIKKKYAFKKYLKHWKERYYFRLLKKARITIRFGFRNYYGNE